MTLLAELENVTTSLADLHREEAVAFVAYRRKYLQSYTALLQRGESVSAAKIWADADSLLLLESHVTVRADIAALTERRDYLRAAVES